MRDMKGIKPPAWSAGEPCHTYGKKEAVAGDITNGFKWIIAGGRTMKRLNRRNKLSLNFSEEKKNQVAAIRFCRPKSCLKAKIRLLPNCS
ncbi:hypothetical protein RUM43_010607 [Polyplax serrata]|uniref:Uncharacterized protein n=1 Tax=Polyplax serrata TaxID=468196 RepID=A0AAN8S860_POLSC